MRGRLLGEREGEERGVRERALVGGEGWKGGVGWSGSGGEGGKEMDCARKGRGEWDPCPLLWLLKRESAGGRGGGRGGERRATRRVKVREWGSDGGMGGKRVGWGNGDGLMLGICLLGNQQVKHSKGTAGVLGNWWWWWGGGSWAESPEDGGGERGV